MRLMNKLLLGVALFALTAGTAIAADWIVDCYGGGNFSTIQEAVNAAGSGDTITVWPCRYDEKVVIGDTKDYLTIVSQEISSLGENTFVRGFKTTFAPNSGPEYVTIKGFWIGGDGLNCQIGFESSGDYATFAFNRLTDCDGQYGGDPGIRINAGNVGNNVHHNLVEDSDYHGIMVEGYYNGCCGGSSASGEFHNIHQNTIVDIGENCIRLTGTDYSQVHQNYVDNCGDKGIRLEEGGYTPPSPDKASGNQIHQNIVCDSISMSSSNSEDNFVHHNFANSISGCSSNTCKKNIEDSGCPLD